VCFAKRKSLADQDEQWGLLLCGSRFFVDSVPVGLLAKRAGQINPFSAGAFPANATGFPEGTLGAALALGHPQAGLRLDVCGPFFGDDCYNQLLDNAHKLSFLV
jgi:hypothetical protein